MHLFNISKIMYYILHLTSYTSHLKYCIKTHKYYILRLEYHIVHHKNTNLTAITSYFTYHIYIQIIYILYLTYYILHQEYYRINITSQTVIRIKEESHIRIYGRMSYVNNNLIPCKKIF